MTLKVRKFIKLQIDVPDLGAKIKAARENDPRSLTELAKAAGVSRTYWYQLESEAILGGMAEVTLRNIEKVLNVNFGVEI